MVLAKVLNAKNIHSRGAQVQLYGLLHFSLLVSDDFATRAVFDSFLLT